jgi:hypothetical protein
MQASGSKKQKAGPMGLVRPLINARDALLTQPPSTRQESGAPRSWRASDRSCGRPCGSSRTRHTARCSRHGSRIERSPSAHTIWLGVECKNTGYTKNLLKEILGIRRELSLLKSSRSTRFSNWPRSSVPAEPLSCLMVYSTDQAVSGYSGPGGVFGIDFVHEPV